MKLRELISGTDHSIRDISGRAVSDEECADIDITAVVNDSRKLIPGCLFLCIKGQNFDGHDAAAEAMSKGAAAIVVEHEVELTAESDVTGNSPDGANAAGQSAEADQGMLIIKTDDTRKAMAYISAAWFGHPADKLTTIGITGTKGKTTTSYLIRSMLENAGRRCGLIGTIEVIIGDEHIHAGNTTPESYILQEYMRKMVDAGLDTVVMEVSSQGLMLHRSDGFIFDYGIFTNIEADHIGPGEHKDFDDYLSCKSLLFRQCKEGILNADDIHVQDILEGHTCNVTTSGMSGDADVRAVNLAFMHKPGELGVLFDAVIKGEEAGQDHDKAKTCESGTGKEEQSGSVSLHVEVPTPGRFSVYNALCAVTVAHKLGVPDSDIVTALKRSRVKGRIEMIPVSDEFTLMIDYAHNAMALKSLLATIRDYHPSRLICLFGCGGNRSRDRRFEMGEVSGRLADLTIITSDNPRFEEPMDIINDIVTGMKKTDGEYVTIPDRKEAIRYVLANAERGDVVVLAGKGHEDYQEIKGVKYPMDERNLIRDILAEGFPEGTASELYPEVKGI